MPSEFIMLQCNFPDLQHSEELKDQQLSNQGASAFLENTIEIIRKKLYDYAPIDRQGIAKLAQPEAAKINNIPAFVSALQQIRPGTLEAQVKPFCKDDRDPARVLEKKLSPVTDIAVGYYFSALFERLFPVKAKASGKPSKKEFRFAANYGGWIAIRKVNLEVAERKEVLSCMVHTLSTIDNKIAQFHSNPQHFSKLNVLLSKYPMRKSFGKLVPLLLEAQKEGLLPENEPFLCKYSLYRIMMQMGFSPYLSGEMLEGIYPELKIPKPRGRMKKE
ncbi:MAG: hypothetical protein ABIG96_00085 [Candidatus Micrarchaeota archaeon]